MTMDMQKDRPILHLDGRAPRISVILPVRNMAKFILETVASIQHQTFRNWEMVVVDDGSSDGTAGLVARLAATDPRISIIKNTLVQGVGNARNCGIKAAKGRFLAFIDGDDLWLPEKLHLQSDFMLQNQYALSYTSVIGMRTSGELLYYETPPFSQVSFDQLFKCRPITSSSVMVDRELCSSFEFPNYPRAQDVACWLRILKDIRCAYLLDSPKAAVIYRMAKPGQQLRRSAMSFFYSYKIYKDLGPSSFYIRWLSLLSYLTRNAARNFARSIGKPELTWIASPSDPYHAFLTTRMPFPVIGGDRIRAHHMLKGLSKVGRVRILYVSSAAPSAMSVLQSLWSGYDLVIYKLSPLASLGRAIKALFSKNPMQVEMFQSQRIKSDVERHIKDARGVFSMLVRTAPMGLACPGRRVLDLTDSIGLHYQEAQKRTRSLLWTVLYWIEGPRLLRFERQMVGKFGVTFLANSKETQYFGNPDKVKWITNGVNPELLTRPIFHGPTKPRVCFLGKMDYRPNIDSCLWFIKHVMPLIGDSVEFYIIGIGSSPELIRAAKVCKGKVTITGFLQDPYVEMAKSLAVVVPIQTGGGVQNKLLEALAIGCPVLASTKAASAIGADRKSQCMHILDSPEEYAKIINEAMKNPDLLEPLRPLAREFVIRHAQWPEIYLQIRDLCSV